METRLHSHTQTQTSVHSVRSLERRFAIDGWMDGLRVCAFKGKRRLSVGRRLLLRGSSA